MFAYFPLFHLVLARKNDAGCFYVQRIKEVADKEVWGECPLVHAEGKNKLVGTIENT